MAVQHTPFTKRAFSASRCFAAFLLIKKRSLRPLSVRQIRESTICPARYGLTELWQLKYDPITSAFFADI